MAVLSKQKEADSQKELEREAALKKSLEDIEAKNKEVSSLEKQVKELEEKLQLAESKFLEKVSCIALGDSLLFKLDNRKIKLAKIKLFKCEKKIKQLFKLEICCRVMEAIQLKLKME